MKVKGQFQPVIQLSTLNGINGFVAEGYDRSGFSVGAAGDVNHDGIGDVIIGAHDASANNIYWSGKTYIIFGKRAWTGPISLDSLNGINGVEFDGIKTNVKVGYSVNAAGDINGDGVEDIIVGSPAESQAGNGIVGKAYIIFGKSTAWSTPILSSGLNGINGFEIVGISRDDWTGYSVKAAGDVNGDEIGDIIIGAPKARPYGKAYIVFGKQTGWNNSVLLSNLNGTNGFKLDGVLRETTGISVSTLGDVNHDGIADIIVGSLWSAFGSITPGRARAYIVFGKTTGWSDSFSLSAINGTNGFVLDGGNFAWQSITVSNANDVNNDDIDDIICSVWGKTYVIFGKETWTSPILLTDLNGINGFEISGDNVNGGIGYSASSAGDVNHDGIDDIIIGASAYIQDSITIGKAYVLFGKSTWSSPISLSTLNGRNGFELNDVRVDNFEGLSVSGGNDVNNDGVDDIIIGSEGGFTGKAYVVFGEDPLLLWLNRNDIIINAGETLRLNRSHLNATSLRHSTNINFTISNIQHGVFQYHHNPGVSITTFPQQYIWDGQIEVVHDGSGIPLSYDVQTNTDTFVYIPPQPANITFIIATPVFINNQLNIARGQTVYVTSESLQARELGMNSANLLFIVKSLSCGKFINAFGEPISSFTQTVVDNGGVRFAHDGSLNPPEYSIAISDGQIVTPAKAAVINFNPTINIPYTPENHTIRNSIISGTVLGIAGIGFFALKLYLERQAAHNLKAVLESKSVESEIDKKEMQEHVLRPVASQLFEYIKTSGCLGFRNYQTSQAYVTALASILEKLSDQGVNINLRHMKPQKRMVLMNEIIRQIKRHCLQRNFVTRFFSYTPDITPAILEEKTDEIVANVCASLHKSYFVVVPEGAGSINSGDAFEIKRSNIIEDGDGQEPLEQFRRDNRKWLNY